MSKEAIKKIVQKRKFSILIIIVLLMIIGVLFIQKHDYKFTLLYQHQTIPDIELINTLTKTQSGFIGEVRGFVKFDNITDQPQNLRQYYIIQPLNKFEGSRQYFSLEEIIKMQYLSPRSLGVSELVEVNEVDNMITLQDESGNKFFINTITKEVSIGDITGDRTTLITSDKDYGDFIKEWLQ